MSSEIPSVLTQPSSPPPKRDTLATSEMLTLSELAQLRRARDEMNALLQKAYPNVKIVQ